jgi:type IV/VI secretion system ImpK/VasF family protein
METAFNELGEVCVQARAAVLAQERTQAPPQALRNTMVAPVSPLLSPALIAEDKRFARATQLARDLAFRADHSAGVDLVHIKDTLRQRLVWLRAKFAEVLSDYDVYFAIFPVVVHFDEFVQIASRGESARWEPLQGELFNVSNGGELFFQQLDDRLRQQETHPLVMEIFYYCLSDGFTGKYHDDPKKLDDYKARLVERIRLQPVPVDSQPDGASPVKLIPFPWFYYAAAILAVAGVYGLLYALAPKGA